MSKHTSKLGKQFNSTCVKVKKKKENSNSELKDIKSDREEERTVGLNSRNSRIVIKPILDSINTN